MSWQIRPALPAGLVLGATDGSVSGTPTVGAAVTKYVVTATNSGGQATASVSIGVSSAPLLDLGHATSVQTIRFGGGSVLTQDTNAHWALWDYAAGTELASGNSGILTALHPFNIQPLPVDLQITTAVIQTLTGLEARASSDGHVLAEITTTAVMWWKIATDDSYICGGDASGLTVWSPTGAVVFSKAGAYASAQVFATPTQILVADGANAGVIETINAASGASTLSATYQGTFSSWFADGSSFLTATGNAIWVYSDALVQEDARVLTTVAGLAGQGGWFWTFTATGDVAVYAVGASAQPATTYTGANGNVYNVAVASALQLGLLDSGTGALDVVDMSGLTLSETSYSTPVAFLTAYGAASGTTWLVGSQYGVLVDGASLSLNQPRFLGYGQALSVAGSTTDIVVATASGRVLYLDATTGVIEGTINFMSSNVALSSDGSVLAAAGSTFGYQWQPDRTLNIYSLPSMTVINSFPYTYSSTPTLTGMSLSASGSVVSQILSNNSACDSEAVAVTGSAVLWCDDSGLADIVQLSPDGTLVAETPISAQVHGQPVTYIFKNGTLSATLQAQTVGWVDNSRLLVSDFAFSSSSPPGYNYTQSSIYSASGSLMSSLNVPDLTSIQVVSTSTVYSPSLQEIYSVTDGTEQWMTGSDFIGIASPTIGAVAGDNVVFPAGNFVLAEPH